MAKTRLEVADNVTVNRAGTIYRPGDTFDADKDNEIERWIALGYVTEIKTRRNSKRKAAK